MDGKPNQIRGTVEDYFKSLFSTHGLREWETILECVEPSVTNEMNSSLICLITDQEIKEVAF